MDEITITNMHDLFCLVSLENVDRLSNDVVNLLKTFAKLKEELKDIEMPKDFKWKDDGKIHATVNMETF